jgi:hypothetical protein
MRAERKGKKVGIALMARTLIVLSAGLLSACSSDPRSVPPGEVSRMSIIDHRELNSTYVAIALVSYRAPNRCGQTSAERILIRSAEGENLVDPGPCTTGLKLGVRTDRTAIGVRYPNGRWLQVSGNQLIEPLPAAMPPSTPYRRGPQSGNDRASNRVPPQVNVPTPTTSPVQPGASIGPVSSTPAPKPERLPSEQIPAPSGPAPYRITNEPAPIEIFRL